MVLSFKLKRERNGFALQILSKVHVILSFKPLSSNELLTVKGRISKEDLSLVIARNILVTALHAKKT